MFVFCIEALALHRGLEMARDSYLAGERSVQKLIATAQSEIDLQPDAKIDYISIADADTLDISTDDAGSRPLMLMAVRFGSVRLIDNMKLFA